jgi:hypothetical protein
MFRENIPVPIWIVPKLEGMEERQIRAMGRLLLLKERGIRILQKGDYVKSSIKKKVLIFFAKIK